MRFVQVTSLILSTLFSTAILANTTVFTNANGYTLTANGQLQQFSQFAINQDKIVAVGDISKLKDVTSRIDLQGQTVLPGIIDAHGHLLGLGQNLMEVDLRNSKTESEAVNKVAAFADTSSETWVVGRGWNQENWDSRTFPTKASLDKAIPDRPVYLGRVDGHAAWVNSKALELAGITKDTISPEGGEIIKDENGEPTGVLIDNAEYLLTPLLPKPDAQTKRKQLEAVTEHLQALGITSMHDAGISKAVRDFYIEQANADALGVRIYAMLAATDPDIDAMLKQGHIFDDDGFLSIRSVKAYGDGALGSRGAAMIRPYSDDPDNFGLFVTPKEEVPDLFAQVIGAGFQLNYHAIGDAANRLALQSFGKTFEQYPAKNQRHRVEHAQVVAVEDIPLFKQYDILPSMQPTHATSDMNMAEDRVGAERLKGAYAWRTFLDQGTRIPFGSDFPVELANPFHGLHAAVTRESSAGKPEGGWQPHQKVTLVEALRGFTIDAAYAAFQEDMLGSIEVGKKADFIVIDRDLFNVDEEAIRNTQVLQTYLNGKRVH